jgi:hypothetical protein
MESLLFIFGSMYRRDLEKALSQKENNFSMERAHRGTVDELLSSAIENGSKATLGCACAPDRRKPIQPAGEATLRKFLALFPACFSEILAV